VISGVLIAMQSSYPQPIKVRETIPSMGGLRARDVSILVARGHASWVGDDYAVFVPPVGVK
jgi:hypothetical protein